MISVGLGFGSFKSLQSSENQVRRGKGGTSLSLGQVRASKVVFRGGEFMVGVKVGS